MINILSFQFVGNNIVKINYRGVVMENVSKVMKTVFGNLRTYPIEVLRLYPWLIMIGFMQVIAFFRKK
jgi:hypothetical protein